MDIDAAVYKSWAQSKDWHQYRDPWSDRGGSHHLDLSDQKVEGTRNQGWGDADGSHLDLSDPIDERNLEVIRPKRKALGISQCSALIVVNLTSQLSIRIIVMVAFTRKTVAST